MKLLARDVMIVFAAAPACRPADALRAESPLGEDDYVQVVKEASCLPSTSMRELGNDVQVAQPLQQRHYPTVGSLPPFTEIRRPSRGSGASTTRKNNAEAARGFSRQ